MSRGMRPRAASHSQNALTWSAMLRLSSRPSPTLRTFSLRNTHPYPMRSSQKKISGVSSATAQSARWASVISNSTSWAATMFSVEPTLAPR